MDLDQLIAGLGIRRIAPVITAAGSLPSVRVCDITEDSRTVMPGSLFIARKGEKSDGRQFISTAVRAGAIAVLTDDPSVKLPTPGGTGHTQEHAELLLTEDLPLSAAKLAERFYGDPSSKLACVGVTGTNGKTTVTWLVHQILNAAQQRCGLMGTVCVDDGSEIAPASLTTPPALEVSRTLARMLECGCKACAMETSSHALHQRRVGAVRFRIGVFTNLTHDHLDYHQTMENYAECKAMLFETLPTPDRGGVAIVNADDPWTARMLRECPARVVRCSMKSRQSAADPAPEFHGSIQGTTLAGMQCVIAWTGKAAAGSTTESGRWEINLPLIGPHNLMNAMQAAAVCIELGVTPDEVRQGLERAKAPPGRLELVTGWEDPFAVYVDYAHTDDALRRVLTVGRGVVQTQGKGRLWVVFGCGGDRDRTKRPKMGACAAELADRIVVTSDNPRTEDPRAILEEVLTGVHSKDRHKVVVEVDRQTAIELAVRDAAPGDLLIIAGKGHEDYQILPDDKGGTRKIHFDDREVSRAALAKRGDVPSAQAETVVRARSAALKSVSTPMRAVRHEKEPGRSKGDAQA